MGSTTAGAIRAHFAARASRSRWEHWGAVSPGVLGLVNFGESPVDGSEVAGAAVAPLRRRSAVPNCGLGLLSMSGAKSRGPPANPLNPLATVDLLGSTHSESNVHAT